MTELFLVAACLFWEGRSEGHVGMQLIYDTIANRAADSNSRWPNSRMGVVLQPMQFSCFNPDDKQPFPNPKHPGDWLAWIQAQRIVHRGVVVHPNLNHYHTDKVSPKWAKGKTPTLRRGRHVFYAF